MPECWINIVRDTREQTPYTFRNYPVKVIPGTLTAGDYSIPGFTDAVAIERKELGDLLGCLTHDRPRFIRELERLRGYSSAALLIEASYRNIAAGQYRSRMNPDAAIQSIIAFMVEYRIPVFFAESRAAGERFCYDFLRHFTRHARERYRAIQQQGNSEE